jgi:hypothetical protein
MQNNPFSNKILNRSKNVQELFLHTTAYAEQEMTGMPSFLEAMRECIMEERENAAAEAKRAKHVQIGTVTELLQQQQQQQKRSKDFVKKCMQSHFLESAKFLQSNLEGQRQLRMEKLLDALKENEPLKEQIKADNNSKFIIEKTINSFL